MEILKRLQDAGFTQVTMLNENDTRGPLVRVMTSLGWTYERFKQDSDLDKWLTRHKPEKPNAD